jgi:hypothetical protein
MIALAAFIWQCFYFCSANGLANITLYLFLAVESGLLSMMPIENGWENSRK